MQSNSNYSHGSYSPAIPNRGVKFAGNYLHFSKWMSDGETRWAIYIFETVKRDDRSGGDGSRRYIPMSFIRFPEIYPHTHIHTHIYWENDRILSRTEMIFLLICGAISQYA